MQGVPHGRRLFGFFGRRDRGRAVTSELAATTDSISAPSRRSVLKGGAVAAAGALGWGAAAATRGAGTATSAAASSSLTLTGTRWRSGSSSTGPGSLAGQGELLGQGGAPLGSFASTRLAVPSGTGGVAPGAELQTFNLTEGTIFGIGTPPARGEGEAAYAILGGTGAYAGATGTYTADQRPLNRGGDGTANFSFTFTTQARP